MSEGLLMSEYQIFYTGARTQHWGWSLMGTSLGRNHDDAVARFFASSGNHVVGGKFLVIGHPEASNGDLLMSQVTAVEYLILKRLDNGDYPYTHAGRINTFDYFFLRRLTRDVYPHDGQYREIREVAG